MNALCDLLGIRHPIIQAPIGPAATPELAAAVCNAGGLGQLAGSALGPDGLSKAVGKLKDLTDRPFGINRIAAFPAELVVDIALREGAKVLSCFWGIDSAVIGRAKRAGLVVLQVVGSAREAAQAIDAGADALVVQGMEAGGHVWGDVSLFALLPRVVDAAGSTPVIAAGGIADGRGLAAALCLGASGVWLGTRFLAASEAGTHPDYQQRLLAADETETTRDVLFDVGWPEASARSLINSTSRAWVAAGRPAAPNRPGEGETVAYTADGTAMPRYYTDIPVRETTGDIEAMAHFAGQSVGLVDRVDPAAVIIQNLINQARPLLGADRQALLG
jgi:nitronate monooxygenase